MTAPRLRPLALLLLVVLGTALAGCGNKEEVTTIGLTEGTYLDVGPLVYQVQISRQLNPKDEEDRAYLQGLTPAQRVLAPQETWFGVFVRVQNNTDQPQIAARDFEIRDTEDTIFQPIALPDDNQWAFRGGLVPANGGLLPLPDSPAAYGVIGGSMLLFKLNLTSLANRPLELKITSPSREHTGTVDLDV